MIPFVPWPSRDDSHALLRAWKSGDRRALDSLYRQLAPPVYRYALVLSGDESLAGDVTHEAFAVLAERPAGFDPALGSLGAWLAGIARHALLAHWRRQGRHLNPDEAEVPEPVNDADSPEQLLVLRQDLAALRAALQALPWAYREAVVLVDLQERPYAEAARIAGCELNTLRTRLHRARLRLAKTLNASLAIEPGETP